MPNNALIIARDKNNIIAIDGKMPWNCPEDMEHFKSIRKDFDCLIMGRTTSKSLGKPLKGIRNIVLTTKPTNKVGIHYYDKEFYYMSIDQVIGLLNSSAYCLVIGGAKTALALLDYVDSVFLSTIKGPVTYNKHTVGKAATYFDHNFKKGQFTYEEYNNPKKNKFDIDVTIEYPNFTLDIYERKEPYFIKEEQGDYRGCDNRLCLNCKTIFLSQWVGNRICGVCKSSWDWIHNADLGDETYVPEGNE